MEYDSCPMLSNNIQSSLQRMQREVCWSICERADRLARSVGQGGSRSITLEEC